MTLKTLSTPHDYASKYAKDFEFSVIPIISAPAKLRKIPAVKWELYQIMRASQRQIDHWFLEKNPSYNVGIVTGSISKILVVDVDGPSAAGVLEGKKVEMSTNLRAALQNTMIVRTGSGSYHIYFKIEEHIQISQKLLWTDGKPHSQILLQGDGHYVVAAPSVHENNQMYQWNGKAPHLITKKELEEFIWLVGTTTATTNREQKEEEEARPVLASNEANIIRSLSPDEMQQLLDLTKPYYIDGQRDYIIFYLSGAMRKASISQDSAKRFVKLLCNSSGYADEDLEGSLAKVDRTYMKPIDEVIGKAGLYELFVTSHEAASPEERQARSDTYSRICQIINGEPEDLPDPDNNNNGGDSDDFLAGNTDPNSNEAVMLIRDQAKEDDSLKIRTFFVSEVMRRITFRSLKDTSSILYYDKERGHYRFGGDGIIDTEIERIGEYLTKGILNKACIVSSHIKDEITKHIEDKTVVEEGRDGFDADPYIINTENCLLNVLTGERLPQGPEHLTLSMIPIKYDPDAYCPAIEKFLGEIMPGDLHKLREVLKFCGYILLKDCRYEKGLMALGSGSNGKSKFIALLEKAFGGDDHCSHASLHDLEEDRFARAQLFGMTLNTYADLKSRRLKETGNIKTMISGDSIEAHHKHKQRFKFKNKAKFVLSTNNPPETEDQTYAWYRRWLLVNFDRIFSDEDKDPNILDKITTPEELSGFLNLAIKYLQVLIKENGFVDEPIEKIKKEYEFKADHVSRYLQQCCTIDFNKEIYKTRTEKLYDHYVQWCKEVDGTTPLSDNVFGSKLLEFGIVRKRARIKGGNERPYFYMSVALNHELHLLKDHGQGALLPDDDNSPDNNTTSGPDNVTPLVSNEANNDNEAQQQPAKAIECPYCSWGNEAGSTPLFLGSNLREVQLHILFRHPGLEYEDIFSE